MLENMTEEEISTIFQIVLPFRKMLNYERQTDTNHISVWYTLPEDSLKVHELNLLSDDVCYECEKVGKERILENGDRLYQYSQFTVARDYTKIWLNNPYM